MMKRNEIHYILFLLREFPRKFVENMDGPFPNFLEICHTRPLPQRPQAPESKLQTPGQAKEETPEVLAGRANSRIAAWCIAS